MGKLAEDVIPCGDELTSAISEEKMNTVSLILLLQENLIME